MKIYLPTKQEFSLNAPIITAGNFTWGEATKGGKRIPETIQVVERIEAIALEMEKVRSFLGNQPIKIHSWYRPWAANRAVGGASQSRHLVGDAVDFSIESIPPLEVFRKLDEWWGARGGLGKNRTFTHIDLRGFKARWDY